MDRRGIYYNWTFGTTKISMPGQMPAIRSSIANPAIFQGGSRAVDREGGGYPLEALFLGRETKPEVRGSEHISDEDVEIQSSKDECGGGLWKSFFFLSGLRLRKPLSHDRCLAQFHSQVFTGKDHFSLKSTRLSFILSFFSAERDLGSIMKRRSPSIPFLTRASLTPAAR
jgi:hypothetical protein